MADPVGSGQRFTASQPCPVCGGHQRMRHGRGERCHGFLSSDGAYAHCSREEFAGPLAVEANGTYAHRLRGGCKCGRRHGDLEPGRVIPIARIGSRPTPVPPAVTARPADDGTTRWTIRDADGVTHAYHVRYQRGETKSYSWERPDGATGLNGTPAASLPLYGTERLARHPRTPVTVAEGEKAADALLAAGVLAVGTVTGAASCPDDEALAALRDHAPVTLWPDNDEPGHAHMAKIAGRLDALGVAWRMVAWPDAPPRGDAADAEPSAIPGILAAAVGNDAPAPRPSRLLTVAELLDAPPPAWLVEGVFVAGSLACIAAAPASFKSFVALDVALSVAAGIPWGEHPTAPGPAVYVAGEGRGGLGRRIGAWLEARDQGRDIPAHFLPQSVNLLDTAAEDVLLGEVTALAPHPALIVVDTVARSMVGDENSTEDMGRYVAACDRLREATGACVLLVHHVTKAEGKLRGAGALLGALDTLIYAKRAEHFVELFCDKQKDAEEFARLVFRRRLIGESMVLEPDDRRAVIGRVRSDAELTDSQRVALDALRRSGRAGFTAWRVLSGIPERTFTRVVRELVDAGLVGKVEGEGRATYHRTDDEIGDE